MGALWTVAEIARVVGASGTFEETPVTGVSIDTRTLQTGDVFVALSGTPSGGFVSSFASKGDGHQWLATAAEKGAAAAIVSVPVAGLAMPQIIVADTLLDGLWKLGAAARARFRGKLIGLTGSAGKSGTKEFLGGMLEGSHAAKSSYNNFWGVPLTLANMPPEAPYAVVEMGMNQPGELVRLAQLAQPDVALVVNVRPVHLELLGSLEAIAREKLSIRLGLKPGGKLVLPMDVSLTGVEQLPERVVRFGPDAAGAPDVFARDHFVQGEDWLVAAEVDGEAVEFMLQQGAPHRLWNALAALAAAWAAGADVQACAARLGQVGTMSGRGVASEVGGVTLIDDSFNANPASVAAALQALMARQVKGRRIAVLGDMLELGAEGPRYHAGLAAECLNLDGVFCVGPLMRNLYDALPEALRLGYHDDPATLEPKTVKALLKAGDTVVVKGSKRMFWVHQFASRLAAALAG